MSVTARKYHPCICWNCTNLIRVYNFKNKFINLIIFWFFDHYIQLTFQSFQIVSAIWFARDARIPIAISPVSSSDDLGHGGACNSKKFSLLISKLSWLIISNFDIRDHLYLPYKQIINRLHKLDFLCHFWKRVEVFSIELWTVPKERLMDQALSGLPGPHLNPNASLTLRNMPEIYLEPCLVSKRTWLYWRNHWTFFSKIPIIRGARRLPTGPRRSLASNGLGRSRTLVFMVVLGRKFSSKSAINHVSLVDWFLPNIYSF